MKSPEPTCAYCGKRASELEEYVEGAAVEGMSPAEFARSMEGTYNPKTNRFACTPCYAKIGAPSRRWPDSWRAP